MPASASRICEVCKGMFRPRYGRKLCSTCFRSNMRSDGGVLPRPRKCRRHGCEATVDANSLVVVYCKEHRRQQAKAASVAVAPPSPTLLRHLAIMAGGEEMVRRRNHAVVMVGCAGRPIERASQPAEEEEDDD